MTRIYLYVPSHSLPLFLLLLLGLPTIRQLLRASRGMSPSLNCISIQTHAHMHFDGLNNAADTGETFRRMASLCTWEISSPRVHL